MMSFGGLGGKPKTEICERECELTKFVAVDKVICLNEKQAGSGQKACITTTRLLSDCDEQLLLMVPYREVVTLSSISIGVPNDGLLFITFFLLIFFAVNKILNFKERLLLF